jgi:hypothetical protein
MQDKYCPTRWRGETRAKGVLRHVRGKRVNDLGRAVVQPPSAAGQPLRHDTERRTHHTIASPSIESYPHKHCVATAVFRRRSGVLFPGTHHIASHLECQRIGSSASGGFRSCLHGVSSVGRDKHPLKMASQDRVLDAPTL